MYMPGLRRTGSRPSRIWIWSAEYGAGAGRDPADAVSRRARAASVGGSEVGSSGSLWGRSGRAMSVIGDCSGCDVSCGCRAKVETARLFSADSLKSAVPDAPILPARRPLSLSCDAVRCTSISRGEGSTWSRTMRGTGSRGVPPKARLQADAGAQRGADRTLRLWSARHGISCHTGTGSACRNIGPHGCTSISGSSTTASCLSWAVPRGPSLDPAEEAPCGADRGPPHRLRRVRGGHPLRRTAPAP